MFSPEKGTHRSLVGHFRGSWSRSGGMVLADKQPASWSHQGPCGAPSIFHASSEACARPGGLLGRMASACSIWQHSQAILSLAGKTDSPALQNFPSEWWEQAGRVPCGLSVLLPPAKPTSPHFSSHHCSWALRPRHVSCLSLEYSTPLLTWPVCESSSTLCDHPCPLPSRPPPVSPDRLCDRQHTVSGCAEFPPRPRAPHLAPHGPLRSHLSCRLACPRCNTCAGGAQARGVTDTLWGLCLGPWTQLWMPGRSHRVTRRPSVPFLPQSRTSRVSSAGGWATPMARQKTGAVRAAQARVNGAATFWGP